MRRKRSRSTGGGPDRTASFSRLGADGAYRAGVGGVHRLGHFLRRDGAGLGHGQHALHADRHRRCDELRGWPLGVHPLIEGTSGLRLQTQAALSSLDRLDPRDTSLWVESSSPCVSRHKPLGTVWIALILKTQASGQSPQCLVLRRTSLFEEFASRCVSKHKPLWGVCTALCLETQASVLTDVQ